MDVKHAYFYTWKGQFWLSAVLAVLTLGVFYTGFGIYFESSEPWVASILYGDLTASPHGIWFTDNHFLQIPILARLSIWFPDTPVYGIWYGLLMGFYTWLWFFLCIRITSRHTQNILWLVVAVVPFVWAVLGTSLVYAYFMRVSILLATASLLLYLDYFIQGKFKPIFILFFLLGCSMRVSSAMMVLGFITIVALLSVPEKKALIKILWAPWLLGLLCVSAVMLYKSYSDNRGAKIDQILEYALLDRQAVNPISIANTAQDSMRYQAVVGHFLISDSSQITIDFVKRLIDYEKLNLMGIDSDDVDYLSEACLPWLGTHKWILLLLYSTLLVLAYRQSWRITGCLFLLHLIGWGTVAVIGMKINMYHYFLEPWLAMLFGASYFLLLVKRQDRLLPLQKVLLIVFPVCACINLYSVCRATSLKEKDHNAQAKENLDYLGQLAQSDVPIVWVNLVDYHFFPSTIFMREDTKVFRKCEYLCTYFWNYYAFTQERCMERFGFSPLDWRGMNKNLYAHRNEVCFVMEERLAKFLPQYYKEIYGLEFDLKRDFSKPEVIPGIYIYRL